MMMSGQTITIDTALIGLGATEVEVVATNGTCTASDSLVITFLDCTGIAEGTGMSPMIVYPNPTTGAITLALSDWTRDAALCIYDLQGKLQVNRKLAGESVVEIDLSGFPAGIYLIRVFNDEDAIIQKVVKE
jgi:hypothetical protein